MHLAFIIDSFNCPQNELRLKFVEFLGRLGPCLSYLFCQPIKFHRKSLDLRLESRDLSLDSLPHLETRHGVVRRPMSKKNLVCFAVLWKTTRLESSSKSPLPVPPETKRSTNHWDVTASVRSPWQAPCNINGVLTMFLYRKAQEQDLGRGRRYSCTACSLLCVVVCRERKLGVTMI